LELETDSELEKRLESGRALVSQRVRALVSVSLSVQARASVSELVSGSV
jgi:hypothetical protein